MAAPYLFGYNFGVPGIPHSPCTEVKRTGGRVSDRQYSGKRTEGDGGRTVVVEVMDGHDVRPLPSRLDLMEQSTTLEWGYGMGGPAQLALAILADVTGDDAYAERHHQWFKLDVVSRFSWDEWGLRESQVWDWINEHHPLKSK